MADSKTTADPPVPALLIGCIGDVLDGKELDDDVAQVLRWCRTEIIRLRRLSKEAADGKA